METLCRLSYWGEQATRIHAMAPSPGSVRVVAMTPEHADDVLRIYQAGIDSGDATFEPAAPSWPEFDAKFRPEARFVALSPDRSVLGWVALSSVSSRRVYAGVAEVSVYVSRCRRTRRRASTVGCGYRGERGRRHLDAASRHFPRERREPGSACEGGLPHGRRTRANGTPRGQVAGRRPARTPQPQRRVGTREPNHEHLRTAVQKLTPGSWSSI